MRTAVDNPAYFDILALRRKVLYLYITTSNGNALTYYVPIPFGCRLLSAYLVVQATNMAVAETITFMDVADAVALITLTGTPSVGAVLSGSVIDVAANSYSAGEVMKVKTDGAGTNAVECRIAILVEHTLDMR